MLEISRASDVSNNASSREAFLDTFSATDRVFIEGLLRLPTLFVCAVTANGVVAAANDRCVQYVGRELHGQPLNHVLTSLSPQRLPWWHSPFISYQRTNVLHLVGSRHVLQDVVLQDVVLQDVVLQDVSEDILCEDEMQADSNKQQVQIIASWQLNQANQLTGANYFTEANQPVVMVVFCPYEQLDEALDSLEHALEVVYLSKFL
jgi:hypothetical protein